MTKHNGSKEHGAVPFLYLCGLIGMVIAGVMPGGLSSGEGFIVGIIVGFFLLILILAVIFEVAIRPGPSKCCRAASGTGRVTTIDLKMWSDPGWDEIRAFHERQRQKNLKKRREQG